MRSVPAAAVRRPRRAGPRTQGSAPGRAADACASTRSTALRHGNSRASERGLRASMRAHPALVTRSPMQVAVFFSAPPHDVLSSGFAFHMVKSETLPDLGSSSEPAPHTRPIPCTPNRVRFFPLASRWADVVGQEEAETVCSTRTGNGMDEDCAEGVRWIQLVVERSVLQMAGVSPAFPAKAV